MTIQDVITELRSECKAYIGIMPQPTFTLTIQRIEQGTAKPCTIKAFFGKFGYSGDFNEWAKVSKTVQRQHIVNQHYAVY